MIPENILPAKYLQQWCVAGGWAASPAQATDQDVWVYDIAVDQLNVVRLELLQHLALMRKAKKLPYYKPEDSSERAAAGYMHPCLILKVAEIRPFFPAKPVHLMVTNAMAPGEIIGGFDINTHAVAIRYDGAIYTHPKWEPVTKPPMALLNTDTTPARMVKLAKRYGHPIPEEVAIG